MSCLNREVLSQVETKPFRRQIKTNMQIIQPYFQPSPKNLYSTSGDPARCNDKTIVLMDELATRLKKGKIVTDNVFELFDYNDNDNVIIFSIKYREAWLLVENGYLNWSTTIPPLKQTMMHKETRWSEWLESVRKNVECIFGILKDRWRILKSGIRLHGVDACDNI